MCVSKITKFLSSFHETKKQCLKINKPRNNIGSILFTNTQCPGEVRAE